MVGGMVPASSMAPSLASSAISLDYPLTPPIHPAALKPSVDFVQIGLSGEIETDIVIMELTKEEKAVLLGTSRGVYIISTTSTQAIIWVISMSPSWTRLKVEQ